MLSLRSNAAGLESTDQNAGGAEVFEGVDLPNNASSWSFLSAGFCSPSAASVSFGRLSTCGWNAGLEDLLRSGLGGAAGDLGPPFAEPGRARIVNGGGAARCPFCDEPWTPVVFLDGEPDDVAFFGSRD